MSPRVDHGLFQTDVFPVGGNLPVHLQVGMVRGGDDETVHFRIGAGIGKIVVDYQLPFLHQGRYQLIQR
jgi:hypothetical protein